MYVFCWSSALRHFHCEEREHFYRIQNDTETVNSCQMRLMELIMKRYLRILSELIEDIEQVQSRIATQVKKAEVHGISLIIDPHDWCVVVKVTFSLGSF